MANNSKETERRFEVIRIARKWLTSIELELQEDEPDEDDIQAQAQHIVRRMITEFGPKE